MPAFESITGNGAGYRASGLGKQLDGWMEGRKIAMRRQTNRWSLPGTALTLAVAALIAGCGKVVERQVEKSMRADLQRLIGPAQDYSVDIRGLNVSSGTASGATVIGQRVQLPDAPVLDRMEVRMSDVRYDIGRKELQSVASASAVARLRPVDIAAFLNTHRNMEDAALSLSAPNEVTISLRPEMSGLSIPSGLKVSATGRLVGDGPRVRFELIRVGAGGLSVGGAVAEAITRGINPIVDLSGMPIGVTIADIRAEDGALTVRATGDYRVR